MIKNLLAEAKERYEAEKARLKGEARSQARILKQAVDVPGISKHLYTPGHAQVIPGASIRMLDGKVMTFHTDGSLRHHLGKPGKAARKALKRARQANARKARL